MSIVKNNPIFINPFPSRHSFSAGHHLHIAAFIRSKNMATRTPYGAPGNKFSQGPIAISAVLAFPEIQLALNNMNRWSTPIKNGVASVLSNRSCFNRVNATANENAQFDLLMAKVGRCMDRDANVSIRILHPATFSFRFSFFLRCH